MKYNLTPIPETHKIPSYIQRAAWAAMARGASVHVSGGQWEGPRVDFWEVGVDNNILIWDLDSPLVVVRGDNLHENALWLCGFTRSMVFRGVPRTWFWAPREGRLAHISYVLETKTLKSVLSSINMHIKV